MKVIQTHFRENILFYILFPLIIVVGLISYFRFIVNHDYMVGYNGTCDPTKENCFIACEDDACIKESYYSEVMKYASDLYRECGKDITNCEAANACLLGDKECSVTYCDTKISGNNCKTPAENTNYSQTNN